MTDRTPKVFISYSWTTPEYKATIKEIAEKLMQDGIEVKLDIWDLKDGQDKYVYMEQCVNDTSIDKVLIMSDRMYAEKADSRKGGVGDETTIISPKIYNDAGQQKFIPIVMERDEKGHAYLPAYLQSRLYKDFSGGDFEKEYKSLVRTIYEEPLERKPAVGKRPKWLDEEPPELSALREATKRTSFINSSGLNGAGVYNFVDSYIDSIKHFYNDSYNGPEDYIEDFIGLKEYRDVFLDYLSELSRKDDFGIFMADAFEKLYNKLNSITTFNPNGNTGNEDGFNIFNVHIWELFICTTAFMLHNEMYSDLHDMLCHTYFLKDYPNASTTTPSSYEKLRYRSSLLDERYKSKLPDPINRCYTVVGNYVIKNHEYLPIYSGKAMANADLFLFQVYDALELEDITSWYQWFPTLYVYADNGDSLWKRLKSKQFCKKIMPLFGVKTIDELVERVRRCEKVDGMRYSHGFAGVAPAILTIIQLDEIAKLP